MRLAAVSLLAALTMALPQVSLAQTPLPPHYFDKNPEETARAAFSAPYGALLVAEFGSILGDSADQACLAAKGLRKDVIAGRAHDILVHMAAQMSRTVAGVVNREVFKAKFDALQGVGASDELVR